MTTLRPAESAPPQTLHPAESAPMPVHDTLREALNAMAAGKATSADHIVAVFALGRSIGRMEAGTDIGMKVYGPKLDAELARVRKETV